MSNSQPQPENPVVLFLDRTHQSKDTARLLRKLGILVELHKDHFEQDSDDAAWIPVCAANGWAILTGDKGIEYSGINRAAVIASGAKVFVISDYKTRGLDQTAALITARHKIVRLATNNVGPFYCTIEMVSDSHVGKPRFEQGGYALEKEALPEFAVTVSEPAIKEEPTRPSSGEQFQAKTTDFS